MLVSNPKAKDELNSFIKLSTYKKMDCAGRYLNNIGYLVENKMDFINRYMW